MLLPGSTKRQWWTECPMLCDRACARASCCRIAALPETAMSMVLTATICTFDWLFWMSVSSPFCDTKVETIVCCEAVVTELTDGCGSAVCTGVACCWEVVAGKFAAGCGGGVWTGGGDCCEVVLTEFDGGTGGCAGGCGTTTACCEVVDPAFDGGCGDGVWTGGGDCCEVAVTEFDCGCVGATGGCAGGGTTPACCEVVDPAFEGG